MKPSSTQRKVSEKRVGICLKTIDTICKSPSLGQYLIGFTVHSAGAKGDSYRQHNFDHLVILADKMTRAVALDLERRLQREIFDVDRRCRMFQKYHEEKRKNGIIFSSFGGSLREAMANEFSVYMAWCNS
jgi:hypothetical protein